MAITGQVILRDTGANANNGKKLFIAVGIVGMDEAELANYEKVGEQQFTIKNLELVDPIDQTDLARGQAINYLLRMPIWRV